jgi:hypothetical protein
MEKVIVIGLFVAVVAFFLIAYNRASKGSEKITGRGGDFES